MVFLNFHPGNPRFRRFVMLTSVVGSSTVGFMCIIAGDFGSQENCFSPIRRFLNPRIDSFFGITEEEVDQYHKTHHGVVALRRGEK
jgi:hypothetical protein